MALDDGEGAVGLDVAVTVTREAVFRTRIVSPAPPRPRARPSVVMVSPPLT